MLIIFQNALVFLVYIIVKPFENDWFIWALAVGHNLMSGYAATRSYYTAPQGVPAIFHGTVASIMNVRFISHNSKLFLLILY